MRLKGARSFCAIGLCLLTLLWIGACTATQPPEQSDSGIQRVAVALEPSGIQILEVRAGAPSSPEMPGEPSLFFELRDDGNNLVHSGRVTDPRHLHAEWIEGATFRRSDVQSELGSLVLYLPSVPGTLTFY